MNTNLTINGQIMAILEKEYNSEKTVYIQFLMQSEKKGFEVIKVKCTVETDYAKLQQNQNVSIPVSIAVVNSVIYYSQVAEAKILREQK
ncbi:hypothetical protein [Arcobacter sp. LA11]|uniref:hypothetical protein n=1 Tax=Arcobacter sp. LA11 TaxID=1898176 RepID=UPI000935353B|nr:hypothetical protein [Arcobacter sp. LA11]